MKYVPLWWRNLLLLQPRPLVLLLHLNFPPIRIRFLLLVNPLLIVMQHSQFLVPNRLLTLSLTISQFLINKLIFLSSQLKSLQICRICLLVRLQHLLRKCQSQICLLIFRIIFNTVLSIRNSQSVILQFDVSKWSVSIVNGYLVDRHPRSLSSGSLNRLGVQINRLLELVGLEMCVTFLLVFLACCQCVLHDDIFL